MVFQFKKNGLELHIKRRSIEEWFTLIVFMLPFTYGLLFDLLNIPDNIKYAVDVILLYLCVVFICRKQIRVQREIKPIAILVLLFFIYTFVVYCFNFQSPFYYFWGARNNFRFYIAFFAYVTYVDEREASNWFNLLDVLFWINFAASIIQFFFLNIRQDYLGGIFGTSGRTNGYMLLFLSIIIIKSFLSVFNEKEKMINCLFKCGAALLIAAMAEMKFFYVLFILILIATSLLTNFSIKKILLFSLAIICVIIGSNLLSHWFGFEDFLSFENLLESATKESYSSANDVNRLSAISTLKKSIMTDPIDQLFGLGLGNCDVSSYSIFNSSFSVIYGYLHYIWLTAAMLFLETGYIGMAFYIAFFVFCMLYSIKQLRNKTGNRIFCQMTIVMALICCIILFYNSSLRIEAGYMAYFVLALPFMSKSDTANGKINTIA